MSDETDLIERVADACQEVLKRRGMNSRPHALEMARAAIEAMREPTQAMADTILKLQDTKRTK